MSALDYFAGYATRKLSEGIRPEDIKLLVDLPSLRDASVSWALDAFDHFTKDPELVRLAWRKSEVP